MALASAIPPSTVKTPLLTLTEPPLAQVLLVQSGGSAVPENSEPAVGWRITSPSVTWTTAAPVSGVPAPKSAAVMSVNFGNDVVYSSVMSPRTGVSSALVVARLARYCK